MFVASFTPSEVRELLELRGALDVLAIRLVAVRATDERLDRLEENLEGLSESLRGQGSKDAGVAG